MASPVCDSGTGSSLCYGIGTGKWQWYESTPVADIAVNRHPSSISSLEPRSRSSCLSVPPSSLRFRASQPEIPVPGSCRNTARCSCLSVCYFFVACFAVLQPPFPATQALTKLCVAVFSVLSGWRVRYFSFCLASRALWSLLLSIFNLLAG